MTDLGFDGHKAPWGAFWGQRYASLPDPDGNGVDLYPPSGGPRSPAPARAECCADDAAIGAPSAQRSPGTDRLRPRQVGGAGVGALGVDAVVGDGLAHQLGLDLALLGQRPQGGHHDLRHVDLEERPQLLAGVGPPKPSVPSVMKGAGTTGPPGRARPS